MRYLYGNSTPSPLKSNFLAYVRDAMEFCVHLLLAQERITRLRNELQATEEHAASERRRIDGLRTLVVEAADSAETDGAESVSRRAVDRVKAAADQTIAAILAELESKLAAERSALAARDREERDGCLDSFGKWVAVHQPHEGEWKLSAHLSDAGRYAGEVSGAAPYGIAWRYSIELESGHPMANGSRVGDLVTQLEFPLPEAGGGWLKKNTKLRPQRIDDYSIDRFEATGEECTLALRATPRGPAGLDVTIRDERVSVTLAGAKEASPVDVNTDNRQRLLTLRDRLLEALTTHEKVGRKVAVATMDDAPLCGGDDLTEVAQCLIAAAAPIVQHIRNHSLSPDELVIRRLIGDDQRVEIFVSTASLLEKLGRLPRNLRSLFAPLGLEWQRAQTPLPFTVPVAEPEPERVVAAPAMAEPATERVVEMTVEDADGRPEQAVGETTTRSVPVAAALPPPADTPSVVVDLSADAPPEAPKKFSIDARSKESLASTVKRIVGFAREGHTSEAYAAYAALFEDEGFAQQRPQDQRQVLKLMVMSKTTTPPTEPVIHAYRSALARLQVLVKQTNDPLDNQLVSVCKELLASQGVRDEELRA